MAWSYDELYVGMQPNFRRKCPFCGSEDVTYEKQRYGGKYVFMCWDESCGAVVHFENRDAFGHSGTTYAGASSSVYRWNRRANAE